MHRETDSNCEGYALSNTYLRDTPSTISITKAPDGVFILPSSKMSSTMMNTLPPSICDKMW